MLENYNLPITTQRESLSEIFQKWILNFNSRSTQRCYLSTVNEFARFLEGQGVTAIYQINQIQIIAYRDFLKAKENSSSTISRKLFTISSLFKEMIYGGVLEKNPVDRVRIPRVSSKKIKHHFSDQDINKLLSYVDCEISVQKHQLKLFVTLLITTGQRIGSLLQLKTSDFSQVQNCIVMSITIKGGQNRFVPLKTAVAECLLRLVRKRPDREYLFSAQRGQSKDLDRPMTHAGAYKLIKKAISEAGIDGNFSPHRFRSYVITSLIKKNGVGLEKTQKMVAFHGSPVTTQKYIDDAIYEDFENHPLR